MGDRYGVAESLTGLARSAAERGNLAEAARLLAAAEALLEALGAVLPRRLAASFETSGELVRGGLDQGELEAAQESGTPRRCSDTQLPVPDGSGSVASILLQGGSRFP